MKRRQMFQVLAASPGAASVLLAQQQPAAAPPPGEELPKLDNAIGDTVGEPVVKFFSAPQMAALESLCGLLMPPMKGGPGAMEAGVPEFLDFLVGASGPERQELYRTGLDALNARANKAHKKPYAQLDSQQAGGLLAPLSAPYSQELPSDPFARFLVQARQDVRTATINSREWSAAMAAGGGGAAPAGGTRGGRRGFGGGGIGLYWNPLP